LNENKYCSIGNEIPAEARDHACRKVRKTGQWLSVIYQNGCLAPSAHVQTAAIAAAQGCLSSLVGTADLSLEDFAALALRLIRRTLILNLAIYCEPWIFYSHPLCLNNFIKKMRPSVHSSSYKHIHFRTTTFQFLE